MFLGKYGNRDIVRRRRRAEFTKSLSNASSNDTLHCFFPLFIPAYRSLFWIAHIKINSKLSTKKEDMNLENTKKTLSNANWH